MSEFHRQEDSQFGLTLVHGMCTYKKQQKEAQKQKRCSEQKKKGSPGHPQQMPRQESTLRHEPEENRQSFPYQNEAATTKLTRDRLKVDLREQSAILHSAKNTPPYVVRGMYARQYPGPSTNRTFSNQYAEQNAPVTGSASRSVICPAHQPVFHHKESSKIPSSF